VRHGIRRHRNAEMTNVGVEGAVEDALLGHLAGEHHAPDPVALEQIVKRRLKRLLGTTRRRDGNTQVTYRGHPLYYYVRDRKPGQILCQDVVEFGGTWLVVSPSGRAVR
jgi:hypothetical protein